MVPFFLTNTLGLIGTKRVPRNFGDLVLWGSLGYGDVGTQVVCRRRVYTCLLVLEMYGVRFLEVVSIDVESVRSSRYVWGSFPRFRYLSSSQSDVRDEGTVSVLFWVTQP